MLTKGIGVMKHSADGMTIVFHESSNSTLYSATLRLEEETPGGGKWRSMMQIRPEIALPTFLCQSILNTTQNFLDTLQPGVALEALLLNRESRHIKTFHAWSSQSVDNQQYLFHLQRDHDHTNEQISDSAFRINGLNVTRIPVRNYSYIIDVIKVSILSVFLICHNPRTLIFLQSTTIATETSIDLQ